MLVVNLEKCAVGDFKNRLVYFLIFPELPETCNVKNFQIGYTMIYPSGDTHPSHSHENSEEVYFVTRGKGIMRIDSEEQEIGQGDAVYIPARTEHYTKNIGRTTLEFLWIVSPPSPLKEFLKKKLLEAKG